MVLAVLFCCWPASLLAAAQPGTVAPAGQVAHLPVQVERSRLGDVFVDKCGVGLENLLLLALVEEGYAVVSSSGDDGLRLVFEHVTDRVDVRAAWRSEIREATVMIPEPCDSTIELELLLVARHLLAEVSRARARAIEAAKTAPATHAISTVSAADSKWSLALGAGLRANGRTATMPALTTTVLRRITSGLFAGMSLELGATRKQDLWVGETAASVAVRREVMWAEPYSLRYGLELGLASHLFYLSSEHRDGYIGARIAAPFGVIHPRGVYVEISPFLLTRPVQHEIDGRVAYRAEYVGVSVEVGFQLQRGN